MQRRRLVEAGIGLIAGCALAALPARAHTPYRQWVVYRRKHLLIGCHKDSPATYALAKRIVAALDTHLPDARARVARAPNAGRLASLLGTDQLDVALLARADAAAMAAGRGEFTAYGPVDLATLFLYPEYALIGRTALPARHAWLIAEALHESGLVESDSGEQSPPLAWHRGVSLFFDGAPLPDNLEP